MATNQRVQVQVIFLPSRGPKSRHGASPPATVTRPDQVNAGHFLVLRPIVRGGGTSCCTLWSGRALYLSKIAWLQSDCWCGLPPCVSHICILPMGFPASGLWASSAGSAQLLFARKACTGNPLLFTDISEQSGGRGAVVNPRQRLRLTD